MDKNEKNDQKDILWYQTTIAAWFQTRMEVDKQVLTLSGLGTGLLMTLKDDLPDGWFVILWCAAAFCFLTAMLLTLLIFRTNSDYIEEIIQDQEKDAATTQEKSLAAMTVGAFWLFIAGAFLTIILAMKGIDFFPNAGTGL